MIKENGNKILYATSGKDEGNERYTPAEGVLPIIKYIPSGAVVWAPFDKPEYSQFSKLISLTGHRVISTHIDSGQDFLTYEPNEDWDCIISNPPFKGKRKFFERALSFRKPFALIMANTWLNDSAPARLFENKDLQLLMFDKRMKFANPYGQANNKITFNSSYFCWNFLPKQIIIENLPARSDVSGIRNIEKITEIQSSPEPVNFDNIVL